MHQLPHLPYALSALEPHISAKTLSFHHGKHHQAYVTNLNNLIAETPLTKLSLEEIILESHADPQKVAIFNNAAQTWNHTFFWHSLTPQGGGKPKGDIASLIDRAFGSYEEFVTQFKQAAILQFGSGWAWLVWQEGQLKILKTSNADLPLCHKATALLTCDVWEHAYYLDYQNRRPDYVDTFLTHLVNWKFVEENLQKAR